MPKKVLVVDDSAAIRQSVSFVLKEQGYEVVECEDGVDALSRIDTDSFSLVITDVNMPNMDGITLTGKIRAHAEHKFTPILVLTTEAQSGKMQEGKAAGATGWIVKPFDSEKLLGVVRKLIG
ncbi:response regulator [Spirochaeta africana]|uniref:Response regulator containing a CheY-like receiver domain and a GGDEF domain n=1 Tax=Spirochaeta africana (strain ATCC 700263 / DSM 8902 / Z-7692) TaxID=889378 RepID=H9ULR3_SPIAZ|nr:response regulator [Spirochaeta africana]AFG38456.1 response regulator containing a CheY-like receiver domain and a GGDEF domain [Spirochaeta africana DSM 8902]